MQPLFRETCFNCCSTEFSKETCLKFETWTIIVFVANYACALILCYTVQFKFGLSLWHVVVPFLNQCAIMLGGHTILGIPLRFFKNLPNRLKSRARSLCGYNKPKVVSVLATMDIPKETLGAGNVVQPPACCTTWDVWNSSKLIVWAKKRVPWL